MGLFNRRKPVHVPLDGESVERLGRALYKAHGSVAKVREVMTWLGPAHPDDRERVLAEVARLIAKSASKKKGS